MRLFIPITTIVLIILYYSHFFFLNIFTHSLPYGIYIRKMGEPHINDYAVSCLSKPVSDYGLKRGYLGPLPGPCSQGSIPVLKVIKGQPGDHYRYLNNSLEINGSIYLILTKDSSGRPLDRLYAGDEGVLKKAEYLLISTFAKNSWDSRYWGPVSIQYVVQPIWVFEYGQKH
jgi:conjugative transfer signal peptidase TraF